MTIILSITTIVFIATITKLFINREIEKSMYEVKPEDPQKIKYANEKGFQRLTFQSGEDTIFANFLSCSKESPSVFIVHGNGETLGNWIKTQELLKEIGYNSFVFDYSGFGSSTGRAKTKTILQSTKNAWDYFLQLASDNAPRIAIAHSLGCGILLASINRFNTAPDKVILHGCFSTARETAIHFGKIPGKLSWIMPNILNNKENIKKTVLTEIYLFHSEEDKKIPFGMGKEVAKYQPNCTFIPLSGYSHSALYKKPDNELWERFLNCN